MSNLLEAGHPAHEAMQLASQIIPGTKLQFSEDGTTGILSGEWEISSYTQHVKRNVRKQVKLEVIADDVNPLLMVEQEQYLDGITVDGIVEFDRQKFLKGENNLFGEIAEELLWEVLRDCEGFGFILPTQLPQVVENMGFHPHLSTLINSWKKWGVTS